MYSGSSSSSASWMVVMGLVLDGGRSMSMGSRKLREAVLGWDDEDEDEDENMATASGVCRRVCVVAVVAVLKEWRS